MEREEARSLDKWDSPAHRAEIAAQESTTTTEDPNQSLRGGIRCPYCHCPHHNVTQTRQSETRFDGTRREYILRWRQCRYCKATFKTREVVEPEIPVSIKSPAEARRVAEKLKDTLRNVVPGEDLPNPFL